MDLIFRRGNGSVYGSLSVRGVIFKHRLLNRRLTACHELRNEHVLKNDQYTKEETGGLKISQQNALRTLTYLVT
eukprot:1804331-Amphidinium_carterae.1